MFLKKTPVCCPRPPPPQKKKKKKPIFYQNPCPKTFKISQIANNPLNPYKSSKPKTR
jgi:hypothetical protein